MSLSRNLGPIATNHFAMVPRSDVPRSKFVSQHSLKTTFQSTYLVPIHVDEVLPGDHHDGQVTIFARLSTLLFPIMDNVVLETFFFFVPNRLVWSSWVKFCGEQANPGDSISFTIPQQVSPAGGYAVASLYDYFGLPTAGQVTPGLTTSVNSLPLRGYNLIYNEWFRDENLQNSVIENTGNGPDNVGDYNLLKRGKKHDYFTSCLPWPVKGGVDVTLPLGTSAPVKTSAAVQFAGVQTAMGMSVSGTGAAPGNFGMGLVGNAAAFNAVAFGAGSGGLYPNNLYADLSAATSATINSIRLAVTTQQFLERDARGGSRYTELLRSHFGVMPQDARLQRPEYIGGGSTTIETHAIPQTSATGLTGGSTPLAGLSATSVATGQHRFSYFATEHGYIIGLAHVASDITYQQGKHRMWTRQTRYDFYWPVFANLGEQAVRNDEIYCVGGVGQDQATFGYQERWAEYRYFPSRITGLFRSTSAGTIDSWHLAQKFTALPALNAAFIQDATPMSRVLAAGAAADNLQVLFDSVWTLARTRAMPQFSVPGLRRF